MLIYFILTTIFVESLLVAKTILGESEDFTEIQHLSASSMDLEILRQKIADFTANYPDSSHSIEISSYKTALLLKNTKSPDDKRDILDQFANLVGKTCEISPNLSGLCDVCEWLFSEQGKLGELSRMAQTVSYLKSILRKTQRPENKYADMFYAAQIAENGAKAFSVQGLRHEELGLRSLKGKLLLVNFWATWCRGCQKSIADTKKLYKKYHEEGLEIIGVSADTMPTEQFGQWIKNCHVTWPQFYDENGWKNKLFVLYDINNVPSTLLFNRSGKLAGIFLEGQDLDNRISDLIRRKTEGE